MPRAAGGTLVRQCSARRDSRPQVGYPYRMRPICTQRLYKRMVVAAVALVTMQWCAIGNAQESPFVNPYLELSSAPLRPDVPVIARFWGATGVTATIDERQVIREGFAIEVRTSITLGFLEFLGSFDFNENFGLLVPGEYQVTFVSRNRRGTAGQYGPYATEGTWTLVVVGASDSAFLNPRLIVNPAIPVARNDFELEVRDVTGVLPTVLESGLSIFGNVIEIRSTIELGFINFIGGYALTKPVGPILPGIYTVNYISRTKRPSTELSDYKLEGSWRVMVAESGHIVDAVEYFNAPRNHYFLTAEADEIAGLDAKVFPGWERTGQVLRVVHPGSVTPGAFPVCRYYGKPEAGLDTHFYCGTTQERELLAAQPESWIFERYAAFNAGPMDPTTGECPVNMSPVFRLWNGLAAANHRYTMSLATQQQMVAQGWIPEGSGPIPAVWCSVP